MTDKTSIIVILSTLAAVIGLILWLEWKNRSLQSELNMANFQNEKDQIQKDVAALTPDELKSEFNDDFGSRSNPKP